MPAITATNKLLEILRKSKLLEETQLDDYIEKLGNDWGPDQPANQLAARMVRDGLITKWQAQQLLAGKSRGFLIGQKYKLLELLGVGGMGLVYLCEHMRMHRLVALKILPTCQTKIAGAVERFYREARAAGALAHPNIVRAHDVDRDGNLHFLVIEYVDGICLHEIVSSHGPLPPVRAAHYISQAACGLQHAHEAGWVHRDIKPGNLLLDRQGVVKILDMGLARFFQDIDGLTNLYDQKNVLGTIDYLAPEQALNSHDVDIRADIYSLGATFFFLLTGQNPFHGSTAEKLVRHQFKEPPSARVLRPDVPEAMEAIFTKMMAKNPDDRYRAPAEVVAALTPWTATPIAPPPLAEMPKRSPAVAHLCASSTNLRLSSPNSATVKSGVAEKPTPLPTPRTPAPPAQPIVRAKAGPWLLTLLKSRPHLVALAAGGTGLALLGFVIVLLAFAFSGKPAGTVVSGPSPPTRPTEKTTPATGQRPPDKPIDPPTDQANQLFVTRNAGGKANHYETIRQALEKASPGSRIVVLDSAIQETLDLKGNLGKRVTIESGLADGQRVTWRAATSSREDQPLLRVADVEGFALRGFVLDGADRLAELVRLQGRCPDLKLDNIECLRFTKQALTIACSGEEKRPVLVSKLRCHNDWTTKRTGLVIETAEHLAIQDSRFEGTFDAVVKINGPALDVAFVRNRIWTTKDNTAPWVSDGLVVKKGQAVRLTFAANTLSRLANCLRFESALESGSQVIIRNNLIIGAHALVWVDGPTPDAGRIQEGFPNFAGNVTRPGSIYCSKGLFTTQLKRIDFPYLVLNQTDDRTFLRYKKDSLLATAGADGEPAGVPPIE